MHCYLESDQSSLPVPVFTSVNSGDLRVTIVTQKPGIAVCTGALQSSAFLGLMMVGVALNAASSILIP